MASLPTVLVYLTHSAHTHLPTHAPTYSAHTHAPTHVPTYSAHMHAPTHAPSYSAHTHKRVPPMNPAPAYCDHPMQSDINDQPPDPTRAPSSSRFTPRSKPWEMAPSSNMVSAASNGFPPKHSAPPPWASSPVQLPADNSGASVLHGEKVFALIYRGNRDEDCMRCLFVSSGSSVLHGENVFALICRGNRDENCMRCLFVI